MGAYIRGTVDGSVSSSNVPGRLQFHTASGGTMYERLRITSGGKLGLGETSPDFKFHSKETGGSSIAGLFETNQTDAYISFQASGTTASSTVRIGAVGDNFQAFVNGAERLRITSDGKLIHYSGNASGHLAEFNQTNASNDARILINSPADNNIRPSFIQLSNAGTAKWGIGQVYASTSSGAFHLLAGNNEESKSKFVVTTAGRVGIGTINPNNFLHVKSTSDDVAIFQSTNSGNGAAITLDHIGGSPADNDIAGKVVFNGQDDALNSTTYADIRCITSDVSNGSERHI